MLVDETVFLMAGDRDRSDWVRNLMITPDVELELGDRKRTTRARVVDARSPTTSAGATAAAREVRDAAGRATSRRGDSARCRSPIDWPGGVSYTSLI